MASAAVSAAASGVVAPAVVVGGCPYMCPLQETVERMNVAQQNHVPHKRIPPASPGARSGAAPLTPVKGTGGNSGSSGGGNGGGSNFYLHALEVFTASQLTACGCNHHTAANGSAPLSLQGVKLKALTATLSPAKAAAAAGKAGAGAPSTPARTSSGDVVSADGPDPISLLPVTVYKRTTSHERVDGVDDADDGAAGSASRNWRAAASPAKGGSDAKAAAVAAAPDPAIRSAPALALTLQHLLSCVLNRACAFDDAAAAVASGSGAEAGAANRLPAVPFPAVYHFLADRIRAVKKELVITHALDALPPAAADAGACASDGWRRQEQRLAHAIDALQRMVRFWILSGDVLTHDPATVFGGDAYAFDASLHDRMLTDALLTLLAVYGTARRWIVAREHATAATTAAAPAAVTGAAPADAKSAPAPATTVTAAADAADAKSAPAPAPAAAPAPALTWEHLRHAARFNAYALLLRLTERDSTELTPFLVAADANDAAVPAPYRYSTSAHTRRAVALWSAVQRREYATVCALYRELQRPTPGASDSASTSAGAGADRCGAALVKRVLFAMRAHALQAMNRAYFSPGPVHSMALPVAELTRMLAFDADAEASDFAVAHGLKLVAIAAPASAAATGAAAVPAVAWQKGALTPPGPDTLQLLKLKAHMRYQQAQAQADAAPRAAVREHPLVKWIAGDA